MTGQRRAERSRAAGQPQRRYADRLPRPARTQQLLDAALALVGEGGFDAVSMQAVARRGGVTRPVAYDCFAGRDELLAALITREEARIRPVFARMARAGRGGGQGGGHGDEHGEHGVGRGDGPRGVRRLPAEALGAFLDAVREAPDTWRLLYTPLDTLPDGPRQALATVRAELTEVIGGGFATYTTALGFPADLDAQVAVHLLRAMVEMAGQRVLLDPDRYPPERMTAALEAVLGAFGPP